MSDQTREKKHHQIPNTGVVVESKTPITTTTSMMTSPTSSPESNSNNNNNNSPLNNNNGKEPAQTPLPNQIFVPLILTLFMESISYVTPMPFMGNYVAHLTQNPIVESGRYSGIIVGCFYGGTILSGSWWGRISDQFGRKPVIIFGLIVSGILELLFGLAPNIWICFAVRLFQGLFNGMQATSKTVIAESTDSTNEALGFSLMSLAWSGGTFIGMANGGWLYGVGDPHLFGMSFPAFLPCFTMSMFAFVCVFLIWWILPETNPRTIPLTYGALKEFLLNGGIVTSQHHHQNQNNNSSSSTSGKKHGRTTSATSSSTHNNNNNNAEMMNTNNKIQQENNQHQAKDNNNTNNTNNNTSSNNSSSDNDDYDNKGKEVDFTFSRLWQIPLLRAAMIDYLLLSSHEIAFDETFPLLAVSPDSVAGLAMTVSEVGLTIMYSGFFMIVSVYAFPIVRKIFGDMVYVYASAVLAFCYIAIPQGELGVQGGTHRFYAIALLIPLRTWANDFCYSQALLMIPRSAPAEHVGTVTSMSTSAAAVARLLVPAIASAMFSFSVTGFVWMYPYNSTLTFAVCSLLALAGAIHRRNLISKGMVTTGSRPASWSSSDLSSLNNNNNSNTNSNSSSSKQDTSMV